jgi:two-component sensor histidine kinase
MTERKNAEEHRQLLVNELNHRVKNTLAVVQAIAQQTFRGSNSSADLMAAFQNRLAALAAAHTLLTRANWKRASLEDIFRETTAATVAHRERIRFGGPPVVLQPKKAITLAMALHELCTNAMKHGALSVETGRIDVEWEAADNGQRAFRLVWRETGGPPVTPPLRRGFGSRIIEDALAREIDGQVTMDFRPEGLVCTIVGTLPAPGAEDA